MNHNLGTWNCAAIDHGVTVFPNGKIGPCCKIKADYLKPIKCLTDPDRFADLKTEYPPSACENCIAEESEGITSYRQMFNQKRTSSPGLQFVDIRNTNLCNLKCRYCGPHFSSQWAKELGHTHSIQRQDLGPWQSTLITDSLHWLYFTGGEPMISADHWALLDQLVTSGKSKDVSLLYSSNLTVSHYKDINIFELWKNFKEVNILCSVDAVGQPMEYIRSGTVWEHIDSNIQLLQKINNVTLTLSPVINILNFWFLPEYFDYATQNQLNVYPIVLRGPDYLALDVVPDELKSHALDILTQIQHNFEPAVLAKIKSQIDNNINQVLFSHTVNHVLFLDHRRQENLFDLLPFKDLVVERFIKNHEYE
jgi:sulfatase maturation enzyme AslB (radical SAM superfamily)